MGMGLLSDTLAMLADELAAMPGTSMIGSSVSVPVPKGAEMVKAMREAATRLRALATVTDEDVQRALCAWVPGSEMFGIRWNVASFIESEQAPFTNTSRADVVRAALESFANKEPTDE